MTEARRLRVLLADDHLLVREGLKRLVNEQPDMEVVAEAGNGREAVVLAQAHAPDVALVDVSMPGWDGVTVARELTCTCPGLRIVAVTRHNDTAFVEKMFDAGAVGYVLKQSPSSELIEALRAVASGQQYRDVAVRRAIPPPGDGPDAPAAHGREPLTANEETVLRLIASSWTLERIAEHLTLEVRDVLALRGSAMRKAGLLTRIQTIEYARSRGWLPHQATTPPLDDRVEHARTLHEDSTRQFRDAHRAGMQALRRGDYSALSDAIDEERTAIDAQANAINEFVHTGHREAQRGDEVIDDTSSDEKSDTPRNEQ